jgi:hypothetical protein
MGRSGGGPRSNVCSERNQWLAISNGRLERRTSVHCSPPHRLAVSQSSGCVGSRTFGSVTGQRTVVAVAFRSPTRVTQWSVRAVWRARAAGLVQWRGQGSWWQHHHLAGRSALTRRLQAEDGRPVAPGHGLLATRGGREVVDGRPRRSLSLLGSRRGLTDTSSRPSPERRQRLGRSRPGVGPAEARQVPPLRASTVRLANGTSVLAAGCWCLGRCQWDLGPGGDDQGFNGWLFVRRPRRSVSRGGNIASTPDMWMLVLQTSSDRWHLALRPRPGLVRSGRREPLRLSIC